MATDIEKLVVQLSADFKSLERSVARGQSTFNRQMKTIEDRATRAAKNVDASFLTVGKGFATALGFAGSLKGFQDLVDASTRTKNALTVAGLSGAALTDVYDKLFASAQKNAVPIESLVTLYGRAAQVQKELGVSTSDLVGFTDNVAKALRVAGTDAQTASGALLQLSQALASGTVHAEEFNSINEGALPILQAAAAGIREAGGSVAKLKQMVIDGKLSSQAFFRGIQDGAKILDQKLAGAATTVDQAFTKLWNSLQDAAGRLNDATGASNRAIEVIDELAKTVEGLSHVFQAVSGGPISGFLSKLDQVNTFIQNMLPAIGDLKKLKDLDLDKVAESIGGTNADKLKSAAEQLASALQESVPRGKRSPATSDQLKQVDALVAGLRDGSVTADAFDKTMADLGPKFAKLAEQLKPLIDAYRALEVSAQQAKDATVAAAASQPGLTHPSGDTVYSETKKQQDIIDKRLADASKTDAEKEIDARAKQISKALADAGQTITDAAAKILAKSEIAAETATKTNTAAVNSASDLIKGFEKFRSSAYWDVNHYRVGYGSDTTTDINGMKHTVSADTTTTLADAIRDLDRRIGEFQAGIRDKIGAETFNSMSENQQAALTSIAYNYGSLPDRIVKAIQTGDQGTVYEAIKALGADNGGVNKDRRAQEAQLYLNGAPDAVSNRVTSREDFSKSLKDQQQQLAALKEETGLRASLNPLLEDYGQKLSSLQKAQELFTTAQQEGTAAGKELTSAQQLLNGDLSKLSPEAQKQALAMRSLATEYGSATAASNQLQAAQEKLKESASEFNSLARDVIGGALSDIRSAMEDGKITAKEWSEILVNALNKIADKLQDMLLNQLFPSNGGGLLGSLFGSTTSGFNVATATPGLFSSGGYTGDGGKYQPAGVVHKGEFVFDQEAVRRIGVHNLKMLQRGYANGGLVGMPSIPTIGRPPSRVDAMSHVVVSVDDDGAIKAYVARQGQMTEVSVLSKSKASWDQYRRNQLHNDIESHLTRRRVKGTI